MRLAEPMCCLSERVVSKNPCWTLDFQMVAPEWLNLHKRRTLRRLCIGPVFASKVSRTELSGRNIRRILWEIQSWLPLSNEEWTMRMGRFIAESVGEQFWLGQRWRWRFMRC